MKTFNEVTNLKELELHKIIRDKEARIEKLEDMVGRHKLGHDNDVAQLERLEMELLDREECIYKLNKQCLAHNLERNKYEQMTNDLAVYTLRETVALQQKEIEDLKKLAQVSNNVIYDLGLALEFQEERLKKTA